MKNRVLKKEHHKHREDYLQGLATVLEKSGKGKRSTIVKSIISKENQRSMFRKLAAVYKKTADLSTKCVTVKHSGGTRTISDKDETEQAIMDENRIKYHQTEKLCPFMHEPLKK